MGTYIRRFTSDPGPDVLLNIESVNIIDTAAPGPATGVGTGTALCVGEFEDGPYDPTEIVSADDLAATFGGFGFTVAGVPSQYPCARARYADNAVTPEYWNGNGYLAVYGKSFSRLVIQRVDTSVGTVDFRRRASLLGAAGFVYNIEPGDTLALDKGDGTAVTATFTAAAAVYTGSAGSYPTGFVGGESLTLGYDDQPNVTVTFLASDTTQAAVVARINAAFGFTFATIATGIRLTSRRRGTRASVRVVGASAAGVLTTLGLTVSTTLGTGNVGDVDGVTFPEFKAVVEAAVSGVRAEQTSSGQIRLSLTYAATGDFLRVASATATAFGFVAGAMNSNDGKARLLSAAGSYPTGFVGGEALQIAVDDSQPFSVIFQAGDTTQAAVISRINAAAGYSLVSAASATKLLFVGRKNGGRVQVVGASAAGVLTALGLSVGTTQAAGVSEGLLPAGTVLRDATGQRFVTAQSIATTAAVAGPYSAPVRHAIDDGTGTSAAPGAISIFDVPIDLGAFDVVNPLTVSAALSEAQIDTRYSDALAKTTNRRSVAAQVNMAWSARQSNAVRRLARSNALEASANGCLGRRFVVRPPLNTAPRVALSNVAEPGVGATRSDRVIYAYIGYAVRVDAIARVGAAGGAGFTDSGVVDLGSDGFLVSIMSTLPPEENPAQQTALVKNVVGLESGSNVANLDIGSYIAFKAAGICAATFDEDGAGFQSGVTSVDPAQDPNRVEISTRAMADYIQDTLARSCKRSSKKLAKLANRAVLNSLVSGFLAGLLSKNDPAQQRIDGYTLNLNATPPELAQRGMHRINATIRTLNSLNSIVLGITSGTVVEVETTI